ncbi:NADH peroxidase [Varanus komodoensis]|nr:NADH peroxidase [Varanus komodoensis]
MSVKVCFSTDPKWESLPGHDRSTVGAKVPTSISKHVYFTIYAVFSELGRGCWHSWDFWFTLLLLTVLWFFHLYLRYSSQWVFLQAIAVPVTRFQFHLYTVDLCYQNSLVHASEELAVIMVGPLTLNVMMLLLVLMRWGCQLLFGSFPSCMSKLIMAWGLWTVLDPMAVFAVDALLGRLHYTPDKPIADCAKLYWLFLRMEESGIPGVLITVLLYTLLFFISSTILFLYCVRIHNDGWLLDMLQRIQNAEATFFVPFDLEISNQELSYIVKKAEQWRGINGERRKTNPEAHYCVWWGQGFSKIGLNIMEAGRVKQKERWHSGLAKLQHCNTV